MIMRYEAHVGFKAVFLKCPPVLTYRYQIYGVGFNRYSSIEVNIRVQRARLWVTPERGYFTQNRIS